MTDWRQGDAQKLVDMEKEAQTGWPGGGGWQPSAEEEERNIRESDLLGAFVTEEGDRIIGICTIRSKPGQTFYAYVPYLTCRPSYHGQKHGKSTLWSAIDCAYEAGFQKIDIHTWPANTKSVPLYKKLGFMWQPESAVFLENFTPIARRHPLGAAYFAKHDWYDTQVRSLELEEDLVMRGKVRVYEYLWTAENGDSLRMVFDRQSWGILELENNDLMVTCRLTDEKLVAGISHSVRWRIVNKKPDAVLVHLAASGDPGLEVQVHESVELKESIDFEGSFRIDPEIPEKKKDPKAAILRTNLSIGGVELELAAGVSVQQAVEVSLKGSAQSLLVPGKREEAVLTLRSNLVGKSVARLEIAPLSGAVVRKRRHQVALDGKGATELTIPLTATPGAVLLEAETTVRSGGKPIPVKKKRIDLLAAERAGVAGGVGDDWAFLYGGGLLLCANLRHGDVEIYHLVRAEQTNRLRLCSPQLGPPFSWEDFFEEKGEAVVENEEFGAALILRSRSSHRPGITLERRISVGQGQLIRVVDKVINGSARTYELSLNHTVNIHVGPASELVVPHRDGVYRGRVRAGGRNLGMHGLREEGAAWPEGWICMETEEGCAGGLIWQSAEHVEAGGWSRVRQRIGRLPPGQSKTVDPITLFVGDGNWKTVRGWWRLLAGDGPSEVETEREPTRMPVELTMSPIPVLMNDQGTKTTLSLQSVGKQRFNGTVRVDMPAGLRCDLRAVPVSGVFEDKPFKRKLTIATTRRRNVGPAEIGLRFETQETIYRSTVNALVLPPAASEVTVTRNEDGKTITIDNGLLNATVAPEFLGSVISLRKGGEEYLNSAYPTAKPFGWQNPWHGGLSPVYNRMWGSLYQERFHARVVTRRGVQGLVWKGVRMRCTIAQERARGQSLALDYLLAPGADVLAVMLSCRDEIGIRSTGQLGFAVYPAFATTPERAYFYNPSEEAITALAPPHSARGGGWENWGGLIGNNGRCLFLSANQTHAKASGETLGAEGCILNAQINLPMAAGEAVEGLFFLVPGTGAEDGPRHAVWSEFPDLP